jgi:hypothetical protein
MKFHGIKMVGKLFAQLVANVSGFSFTSSSIVLDQTTGSLFYGDPSTGTFRTLNDIPTGSIFLFDSNTTITGYALLTTVDDAVVFITRGSVAGGEAGGSAKSGGSWSYGLHSHGLAGHTHSAAGHQHGLNNHGHGPVNHTHQWLRGPYISYNSDGSELSLLAYGATATSGAPSVQEDGASGYSPAGNFYVGPAGSTPGGPIPDYSGYGTADITTLNITTTNDQPATTWKPKGRNVTRQQRV